MITPRVTRLVRVPDLKAMRAAVSRLVSGPGLSVRRTAVLVPTRGAGDALRRSLENAALSNAGALVLPDIVSRAAFYERLHASLPGAPAMLSAPEREVLLRRAAREAIAGGAVPPFRLRAGLVLQMLDFYDDLRRREQTLDDFARHTTARLADSAEVDRGAERLLRQTEFLCATFARFERSTVETGCLDEHALRAMLLESQAEQRAYTRVVVTVADQAADPLGLFSSDFDLLSRLRGIERLEVIATESRLAAGFHERVHSVWPGVEEVRLGDPSPPPVVAVPEHAEPTQPWFVSRDREEELVRIVRWLKARSASSHASTSPPPLDRIALVFQRPLPYLYLARQVFPDGGIPYEAVDALPLSAEPFAAAVDQVLSFLSSEGNRASAVELLRSPHFLFHQRLQRADVAALDGCLLDAKYAGGWQRLEQLESGDAAVSRALTQLREAAQAARPVLTSTTASSQIDAFVAFLQTFESPVDPQAEWAPRHLRARAAVFVALTTLRDAHARHDDTPFDVPELSGTVRRWIDAQTFAPRTGEPGVWLLDAVSAPYADVDELILLGLVERDWPEPARRSIFYPSSILGNLGWPLDASRMVSARAAFQDLLWAPHVRVAASVFTLEDDAIVAPSPLLEEIESSGLSHERWPAVPAAPVFFHEAVQQGERELIARVGATTASDWLELRLARTGAADLQFKGMTGAREPQTYAISYLERYLECPFKYFANRVLRLPEERDEESGLSAIERGHFIHDVFETFFRTWQARGGRAITLDNVADALLLFEQVADEKLEKLPEADRALERNHLLGSAAASGLAERAFAFEIEQGGDILERLLEHELEGEYTFASDDGPRRVRIRSKADRLDLLADGTIRVIDYKTGKAPKTSKALQLPIYGIIATQALEGRHGRSWSVRSAGYVAFKEKDAFVPMGGRMSLEETLADGQRRLLKAVDGIERGEFPVDPDEPFRCQWCGYASVCRKDYVGDE